jgi:hypothetical protein
MRTIRVFPRRTNASPDDNLAYFGLPDMYAEADKVNVSVTFTWDIQEAERLAKEWSIVAPVEIGGPATGSKGEDFVPGMYVKNGYVITSRGCPNKCWFCSVWKREGTVRELPIRDGWNVLDDNLLACHPEHIKSVFSMLKRQKEQVQFTGGLEAARLENWHVYALRDLWPKQIFFAYDTPDDREPLHEAGKRLLGNGFTRNSKVLRAYVLIGFPKDTFEDAERRLVDCIDAGFMPMAMLYRDYNGDRDTKWMKFQRMWARPAIIAYRYYKK